MLFRSELLPVEEYFNLPRSRNGWPRKLASAGIMERFAAMSKPWGVEIAIGKDGIGTVKL